MHRHVHRDTHAHTRTHVPTDTCADTRAHRDTCTDTHTHVPTDTCADTRAHTGIYHTRAHRHTQRLSAQTHVHTDTRAHRHTCAQTHMPTDTCAHRPHTETVHINTRAHIGTLPAHGQDTAQKSAPGPACLLGPASSACTQAPLGHEAQPTPGGLLLPGRKCRQLPPHSKQRTDDSRGCEEGRRS